MYSMIVMSGGTMTDRKDCIFNNCRLQRHLIQNPPQI